MSSMEPMKVEDVILEQQNSEIQIYEIDPKRISRGRESDGKEESLNSLASDIFKTIGVSEIPRSIDTSIFLKYVAHFKYDSETSWWTIKIPLTRTRLFIAVVIGLIIEISLIMCHWTLIFRDNAYVDSPYITYRYIIEPLNILIQLSWLYYRYNRSDDVFQKVSTNKNNKNDRKVDVMSEKLQSMKTIVGLRGRYSEYYGNKYTFGIYFVMQMILMVGSITFWRDYEDSPGLSIPAYIGIFFKFLIYWCFTNEFMLIMAKRSKVIIRRIFSDNTENTFMSLMLECSVRFNEYAIIWLLTLTFAVDGLLLGLSSLIDDADDRIGLSKKSVWFITNTLMQMFTLILLVSSVVSLQRLINKFTKKNINLSSAKIYQSIIDQKVFSKTNLMIFVQLVPLSIGLLANILR